MPRDDNRLMERVIAEWRRVLKPNGHLFVLMHNAATAEISAALARHDWTAVNSFDATSTRPTYRPSRLQARDPEQAAHRIDAVVHFLNTNLSAYRLTARSYDKLTKTSLAATRGILINDSARNYRNVAFRLSSEAGPRLASLPMA